MENIRENLQEQQTVEKFTSMSRETLEMLITSLGLRMTVRDLAYCQSQYRMRERRAPSVEELRFLDTLYVSRTQRNEFHGLRTFYTSDPTVAETYADLIAKASHIRREDRPYTPNELSGILTRSLVQAGKKISVPTLCVGEDAALRLLGDGHAVIQSAVAANIPATIGGKSEKLHFTQSLPQPNDQILLLRPNGLTSAAFAAMVATLPLSRTAQIVSIGKNGLLDALLTWDGVYLVKSYLPGIENDTPLSALISLYTDSLLIRIDGEHALTLRDAATAAGLTASIIGKCTPNQRLTIRRDGMSPLQIEIPFLRAFAPTLPVDAEIPGICMQDTDLAPNDALQTVIPDGDCVLFSDAIPGTPYALTDQHLLTGAFSHSTANTFRSALFAALYAIGRAVAAGADYEALTLSNHLATPHTSNRNLDMGQIMSALLGVYRAQAELALPDIGGCFAASSDATAQLTVFAAAPKPEKLTPYHFTAVGNNVYLLTPLATENSPVDFEDYRKLLRYVHDLCQKGIALSALAVGENGVEHAVRVMTQSGHGFTSAGQLPRVSCGFLIETQQPIQGMLIGLTTASPTIRIVNKEDPITDYSLPHIPTEQIPMSEVGTAHPILCVPQTRALGSLLPIQTLTAKHHAILKTVPMTLPSSRAQTTELANTMALAHITVIAGSSEEIEQILANRRMQYAKRKLLSRGGVLLCLHTNRLPADHEPIPADHPLFFGTPEVLLKNTAVTFGKDSPHEVHMSASSAAIPRMLACAIAYFQ